jgi:hypothetical protein
MKNETKAIKPDYVIYRQVTWVTNGHGVNLRLTINGETHEAKDVKIMK